MASAYDEQYLYSPYSEDMPEDSDALYATYCGLRRAYSERVRPKAEAEVVDRLFAPAVEEGEMELGNERWVSKFSQGLGMILDMISV